MNAWITKKHNQCKNIFLDLKKQISVKDEQNVKLKEENDGKELLIFKQY